MRIAKRTRSALLALAATALLGGVVAPGAQAAFGITPGSLDGSIVTKDGGVFTKAQGHPYSAGVGFELNTELNDEGINLPMEADLRRVVADIPPGLVGNPSVIPTCPREDFFITTGVCPASTQVGHVNVTLVLENGTEVVPAPVYNLEPPRGVPAQFGTSPLMLAPALLTPTLRSDGDYGITFTLPEIPQVISVVAAEVNLWGVPASKAHDDERGYFGTILTDPYICAQEGPPVVPADNIVAGPPCPSSATPQAFITMPGNCSAGPLDFNVHVRSWQNHKDSATFTTHDEGVPVGMEECDKVPFDPKINLAPTTDSAETASGLVANLEMPTGGSLNPDGTAQSHIKKVTVAFPEGVTLNPSAAEGLSVCSAADYAREKEFTRAGEGCPNASRVGSVSVKSPLIQESVEGHLYLAEQDDPQRPGKENPFDSLLAIYLVARNTERGILVKLPGKVETDERTGRIVSSFDDLPQVPVSSFQLRFREGARAPLVSPPACGTYETEASFVPWSAEDPNNPKPEEIVHKSSPFQITKGVNGGPCPSGGVPPFEPGFSAGSLNNNAGSFSPVTMQITRRDGDQNLTRFDSKLPPGLVAKLAGVSECSEAALAIALTKTGREERANPTCPASSRVGRVLVGAGVGAVLTYVPGTVYLAGPYGGAPLSIAVVVPGVAGPFDIGVVTVREALVVNPDTAEVRVDGTLSDPLPHILEGIPLKVRDVRVYVDRNEFALNPTSCEPSALEATLFGSFADVFSKADDVPVGRSAPFQAASCANLGFKPQIKINLKGGTKRGQFPGMTATVTPRPGDANIGRASVALPPSAFLEQGHIRTICTRVQFAANACPPGSIYGRAKAWTPLLDEPLEGNVYMRSSSHNLPDLVIALRGRIDVNAVARVDSVKFGKRGSGVRASFGFIPDAPISRFQITMQGGKKGLIVNSRDLCKGTNRAKANLLGQNGRRFQPRIVVNPVNCKKAKRKGQKNKR